MIGACLKWVDRRPDVDPLTGEVRTDSRTSAASDADMAALEWALRLADALHDEVTAVTAGPEGAGAVLREALAAGAHRAVRAELDRHATSAEAAAALARGFGTVPAVVVCGAWSLDRGSGSVPAFLAAHTGAAQALGLVTLTVPEGGGDLLAERRLDGGRRERLRIPLPAVLSVEGGSARLRRAPLDGVLAASGADITVIPGPASRAAPPPPSRPYRPRPRVLPGPDPSLSARERILALTGALTDRVPPRTLFLSPDEAADTILQQLRTWGYLP